MRRALLGLLLSSLIAVGLVACRHKLSPLDGDGDGGFGDGGVQSDDLAGVDGLFCASQSKQVESIGVDLLFVIDTSYSMDFNLKWASVAQALKSFVNDSRFTGVGVAIQYFPLRASCDIDGYAQLAVPFDTLPNAAAAMTASIEVQQMAGGTPTVPALQGVLQVAQNRAMQFPDRKVVIVLATDGNPDGTCQSGGALPNSAAEAANLVAAAANASPKVNTFVVGVGAELTALNQIAAAGGGTQTAFLVDTTANVSGAFTAALDEIRKVALTCEFEIPEPQPGLGIDFNRVNVVFTSTTEQKLVFVGDRSGCAANPNGWYYDDQMMPTKVVLCEEVCDAVRTASAGSNIDIVFGCATLIQ